MSIGIISVCSQPSSRPSRCDLSPFEAAATNSSAPPRTWLVPYVVHILHIVTMADPSFVSRCGQLRVQRGLVCPVVLHTTELQTALYKYGVRSLLQSTTRRSSKWEADPLCLETNLHNLKRAVEETALGISAGSHWVSSFGDEHQNDVQHKILRDPTGCCAAPRAVACWSLVRGRPEWALAGQTTGSPLLAPYITYWLS